MRNYLKQIYKPYFLLSINEKINFRQHRNAININGLFYTSIVSYKITDSTTKAPKINNGIYHKQGKTHAKYPIIFFYTKF
jgi:hypothetical protein